MTPRSGILLVDKPVGPTSHDVVSKVRKAAGTRRVGHAGTLDPFASGLLIVLLGQATRLSEYLLGLPKSYDTTVWLGVETDTHDPEGAVVSENPGWVDVTRDQMEAALDPFRGDILQEPPVYSAKKVQGESAHRRVRRGEEVTLEKAPVTIHEMALTYFAPPEVGLRIRCSAGTYIRALGRDLGRALGVGAHLTALRRGSIGAFNVETAISLSDVVGGGDLLGHLIPPARALAHMPALEVDEAQAARLRQGQFLPAVALDLAEDQPFRFLLEGELLAIGFRRGDHLRPRKVLDVGVSKDADE
jgi:tRNA pseudouridine55 synthase